ncbi:hypothetical protein [Viridibacillus arvi]|uniref:hypothetical protein n=1 Tax=Viridibacillus arvi TaxID=263475 RepID=UPI003D02BEE7
MSNISKVILFLTKEVAENDEETVKVSKVELYDENDEVVKNKVSEQILGSFSHISETGALIQFASELLGISESSVKLEY